MEVVMDLIIGSRVMLREFNYTYITSYLNAFVPMVQDALHVSSIRVEHAYLLNQLEKIKQRKTFFFIIFEKTKDRCIGAIEIRGREHSGQLYCWLHPRYWGKNVFRESLMLAARVYFSLTNALYFTARVDIDNTRSYKALKKCGFADYQLVEGAQGKQFELLLRKR